MNRAALELADVHVATAVMISLPGSAPRRAALRADWAQHPGLPPLGMFIARPNPDGAAGCLASHRAVLGARRAPLLVLEDDAVLSQAFTWPLRAPADWQILWLGGQHRTGAWPVAPGWVRPSDLVRTHCYAVRDPQRIYDLLSDVPRMDPFMAALPVPQYAQSPFTVGQRAGLSVITGDLHPQDRFFNTGHGAPRP